MTAESVGRRGRVVGERVRMSAADLFAEYVENGGPPTDPLGLMRALWAQHRADLSLVQVWGELPDDTPIYDALVRERGF
jgi:hypothetical protein